MEHSRQSVYLSDFIVGTSVAPTPIETDVSQSTENQYKKTRMCIYLDRCRNGKNCNFAHSEQELVKIKCRFGDRCRYKDTCQFDHTPTTAPQPKPQLEQKMPTYSDFPCLQ